MLRLLKQGMRQILVEGGKKGPGIKDPGPCGISFAQSTVTGSPLLYSNVLSIQAELD